MQIKWLRRGVPRRRHLFTNIHIQLSLSYASYARHVPNDIIFRLTTTDTFQIEVLIAVLLFLVTRLFE